MNKMYEAPMTEVVEMQMPVVLMASQPGFNGQGDGGLENGDENG